MSAQKLTATIDRVAMTLVNAALLLALPMSAGRQPRRRRVSDS